MMQIEYWIISILLGSQSFNAQIQCIGPKPLSEATAVCEVTVPPKCIRLRRGTLDCELYEVPKSCEGFKVVSVIGGSGASFVPRFGCAHTKGSYDGPPVWIYKENHYGKSLKVEWSR